MGEIIMRRLFLLFVSVLSLLASTRLAAQSGDLTPYEKQRGELATATIEKIINTLGLYDKAAFGLLLQKALEQAEGDDYKALIISENIINKCCDLGETTRTEANLLAGSFDIEEAYTGQTLQAWREIGQWYKQEREKIDATKTEEDIRREKAREEKTLAASNNMLVSAKEKIRTQFLKWATRGEYEKTIDYNNRISEQGASFFDSLCFAVIRTTIRERICYKQVGRYDADNEGVNVRFYYRSNNDEHSFVDTFWSMTPNGHENHYRYFENYEGTYPIGLFLKDGDLYPATYHSGCPDIMDVKLGPPDSITVSIKEITEGVEIPVIENYVFDFLSYSSSIVSLETLYNQIRALGGKIDWGDIQYVNEYGSDVTLISRYELKKKLYAKFEADSILNLFKTTLNEVQTRKAMIEEYEKQMMKKKSKSQIRSLFGL